jgi:uncharacterized membrane protein
MSTSIHIGDVFVAITLVALVAYYGSALVPGIGVVMPMLAAPLAAAFSGLNLDPIHAAPLANIGGSMGVLLGADVQQLRQIGKSDSRERAPSRLAAPVVSTKSF